MMKPLAVLSEIFPQPLREKAKKPKIRDFLTYGRDFEKGDFYRKISNDNWRTWTGRRFPASENQGKITHPGYILDRDARKIKICPCTSSDQYDRPFWYITPETILQNTQTPHGKYMYVLKGYRCWVEDTISGEYMGSWPEAWLIRED